MFKFWLSGILLCGLLHPGRAQWGSFHFQRDLPIQEAGWYQINLPNELFQHLRPDLQDLRIKGINPQGDTLEAPYLLKWPTSEVQANPKNFRIINQSRRGNTFFATLTQSDQPPINRIILDFENLDFDWRVRLEGSQDQREWFTLLDDYRILAFDDPAGDYRFSTLRFPDAAYNYYRIAIANAKNAVLNQAYFHRFLVNNIQYRSYPIIQQEVRENTEQKRSELELRLPWPVPVSRISLPVLNTFDYYRPLRIELLTDSTKTEAGWKYRYTEVYRGVLSSLEEPVFDFPPERTYRIRISLNNDDNRPLQLGTPQVAGVSPTLTTRISEAANYQLVYGWSEALAPRYDLGKFTDKIPREVVVVSPGPEVRLQPAQAIRSPLITNQAWLWAVMAVVIGVLGWFSVRMLRKP